MSNIKSDIIGLKEKICHLESNLDTEITDIKKQEEKWLLLDEEVEKLIKNNNQIVKFNVSGELFATRLETLLKIKDTLFYKLVLSKKFDINKDIYLDRSNRLFCYILDYFRYEKINLNRFSIEDLEELRIETDFYELYELTMEINDMLTQPIPISFTFTGAYYSGNTLVGTNRLEDIIDRSLNTGICCKIPGNITFELNNEFEIERIEIGGFCGNTNLWSSANGSGANIFTSLDSENWIRVGQIPASYANNIVSVSLLKSRFKFIKFESSSYLGISYFRLIK